MGTKLPEAVAWVAACLRQDGGAERRPPDDVYQHPCV